MQLKKNPQLDALNKQAVSRTTMQLKTNPQLDALNKQVASSEKNISPDKKSKSCVGILLRITFIYLPVVMILAASALPSFFGCAGGNKAKQSEGKQYLSSINKGQQAYYAENTTFSNSFNALGLGLKTQTTNYNYSISATKNAAFSYAVSRSETKNLRSYVGAVSLVLAGEAKTTASILCQANSPGNTQLPNPILENGGLVCAPGTNLVTK